MEAHLEDSTLRSYLEGIVDEKQVEQIIGHLANCDTCLERMEGLRRKLITDTELFAQKRSATPPTCAKAATDPFVDSCKNGLGELGFSNLELIGRGGQSVVFRAKSRKGVVTAIKCVKSPSIGGHQHSIERIQREFNVSRSVTHRHIVRALEFFELDDGDIYCLASEYFEGETLRDLVERDGKIEPTLATHIMSCAVDAMKVYDAVGVVHRDLSFNNILIRKAEIEVDVGIIDFGLAKTPRLYEETLITDGGLGTRGIMAPEQYTNANNVGIEADIFALARSVTWAMVDESERRRVIHQSEYKWAGGDRRLARLLYNMTRSDPFERESNLDVIATKLEEIQADRGTLSRLASTFSNTKSLAVLLCIALLAVLLFFLNSGGASNRLSNNDEMQVEEFFLDTMPQTVRLRDNQIAVDVWCEDGSAELLLSIVDDQDFVMGEGKLSCDSLSPDKLIVNSKNVAGGADPNFRSSVLKPNQWQEVMIEATGNFLTIRISDQVHLAKRFNPAESNPSFVTFRGNSAKIRLTGEK